MNATRTERTYPMAAKDIARFEEKIAILGSGCWEWQAHRNQKGYGYFYYGRSVGAHRVSYQHYRGGIEPGMELDHLCRNRACVNPEHLEQVTHEANIARIPRERPYGEDRCILGHLMTDENTFFQKNSKCCRECSRSSKNAWGLKRVTCTECGLVITARNRAAHIRRHHGGDLEGKRDEPNEA